MSESVSVVPCGSHQPPMAQPSCLLSPPLLHRLALCAELPSTPHGNQRHIPQGWPGITSLTMPHSPISVSSGLEVTLGSRLIPCSSELVTTATATPGACELLAVG